MLLKNTLLMFWNILLLIVLDFYKFYLNLQFDFITWWHIKIFSFDFWKPSVNAIKYDV